jgi:hypothetical protein
LISGIAALAVSDDINMPKSKKIGRVRKKLNAFISLTIGGCIK